MSVSSIEEEKEVVIFDNLEILNLSFSGSRIKEAICEKKIYNTQNKLITIKMSNIIISENSENKISSNDTDKKAVRLKEVSEIKYNLFLGFSKECKPASDKYNNIISENELKGQRLIIQDIEISENQIYFKPKKFVFIPEKINPEFPLENNEKIIISDEGNKKIMKLNDKKLLSSEEFTLKGIIEEELQKIKDANSKNNEISSNISGKTDSLNFNNSEIDKNNEKKDDKSTSKKNENLLKFKSNPSSIYETSSKGNDSSEIEGNVGFVFYNEIEKDKKFTKYSYKKDYFKEVDGVYCEHDEIKLNAKELEFDLETNYDKIINKYNIDNDLKAHILIKNFNEDSIPKNAPFFLEIKSGFSLTVILKQIKKASKFINNIKKYNGNLPKYIIGILCSLNKKSLKKNIRILKSIYKGSDTKEASEKISVYEHINRIINKNNIKFVIAVIKNGYINEWNLLKDDYEILPFKRVNLKVMFKGLNSLDLSIDLNKLDKKDEIKKKIKEMKRTFENIYKSINLKKGSDLTKYEEIQMENKIKEKDNEINAKNNEIEKKDIKIKELNEKNSKIEQKLKNIEEAQKNKEIEMNNKMEQKLKEIQEEAKNKMEQRLKEIEEEQKKKERETNNMIEQLRKEIEMLRKGNNQSKVAKDNDVENRKAS